MTSELSAPAAFTSDPRHSEMLWCFAELQAVLLSGDQTEERFSLVWHEAPLGHSPPWHRHLGDDETFYILAGEMTFWAGDPHHPIRRAGEGEVLFLPRQTPHSFRVESQTARWLTVSTPAGHERFYRACGQPAPRWELPPASEPDMAAVAAAAEQHGVELLGPPPGDTT